MRFEWDPDKDRANQAKHGVSFDEAKALFTRGIDYLEIYDEAHSIDEDRFIAIGPVPRGVMLVAFAERPDDVIRLISSYGNHNGKEALRAVLARMEWVMTFES